MDWRDGKIVRLFAIARNWSKTLPRREMLGGRELSGVNSSNFWSFGKGVAVKDVVSMAWKGRQEQLSIRKLGVYRRMSPTPIDILAVTEKNVKAREDNFSPYDSSIPKMALTWASARLSRGHKESVLMARCCNFGAMNSWETNARPSKSKGSEASHVRSSRLSKVSVAFTSPFDLYSCR